jgi:hypothetical protein
MNHILDSVMQDEESRKAFGMHLKALHMLERFRALSQCETEEQETVIRLIDAVIVKRCVESALVSVDAAA